MLQRHRRERYKQAGGTGIAGSAAIDRWSLLLFAQPDRLRDNEAIHEEVLQVARVADMMRLR